MPLAPRALPLGKANVYPQDEFHVGNRPHYPPCVLTSLLRVLDINITGPFGRQCLYQLKPLLQFMVTDGCFC